MKKVFLISAMLLLFFAGRSQISYDAANSKFTLTASAGNHPLFQRLIGTNPGGDSIPRSIFIFEFADGYFTSSEVDPTHLYTRAGNYKTILSLSALYDTIKDPGVLRYHADVTQTTTTQPDQH